METLQAPIRQSNVQMELSYIQSTQFISRASDYGICNMVSKLKSSPGYDDINGKTVKTSKPENITWKLTSHE